MAKLRQRECARKVGPYKTAGPVPLKTPQCCTYQKGLKYVQANACPCRSANRLCTSSFSSEDFSNRVPTWTLPPWGRPRAPTTLRITANVKQNIDEAHKAASILYQATPPSRLSPLRTGVIIQRPHKQRGVECLTGSLQNRPLGPSAHQDRHPWRCHTSCRQKRQRKFKSRMTNGWSKRVSHSTHRT